LLGAAPDILVNNAGSFFIRSADETSVNALRETLELNLVAPFALVHELLPAMRQSGHGHIVTIGSIADRVTFPGNLAYASSKFGLRAMHEVLRAELKGSGVRASLVSPGPVDTELWESVDPAMRAGLTPRSEMLSAEAVANAVHYVVSQPTAVNIDELRLSRA
jgi:NADP-dependent 3-hydroxy acid dehydrogenase YdfG